MPKELRDQAVQVYHGDLCTVIPVQCIFELLHAFDEVR